MNQDLTFIEHLQAHPGDDFCRLTYCDYLDEHSDIRGMYLRDELALMQTYEAGLDWRAGLEALKHLHAQIDPQWLARVGIRCDVRLEDYQLSHKIPSIILIRKILPMSLLAAVDVIEVHRLIQANISLPNAVDLKAKFDKHSIDFKHHKRYPSWDPENFKVGIIRNLTVIEPMLEERESVDH